MWATNGEGGGVGGWRNLKKVERVGEKMSSLRNSAARTHP